MRGGRSGVRAYRYRSNVAAQIHWGIVRFVGEHLCFSVL